jgi:hypothetical protein
MRSRVFLLLFLGMLFTGLQHFYFGSTSTSPVSWIRLILGVVELMLSAFSFYLWSKERPS